MFLRRLATAILAVAAVPALLVLGPAGPSHAACSSFKFNGQTTLDVGNGEGVTFLSFDTRVAPTANFVGVMAAATVGNATGGVTGRNLDITVNTPDNTGSVSFRGVVNDTGVATGTATVRQPNGNPFDLPLTTTGAPLVCADAPKSINVTWQEFVGGIRATVSMANNTGQVGCTYSTQGLENFDRRFTLFDDKPTDVTISPAVPLFRVWPVTITCDNGVILETERFY